MVYCNLYFPTLFTWHQAVFWKRSTTFDLAGWLVIAFDGQNGFRERKRPLKSTAFKTLAPSLSLKRRIFHDKHLLPYSLHSIISFIPTNGVPLSHRRPIVLHKLSCPPLLAPSVSPQHPLSSLIISAIVLLRRFPSALLSATPPPGEELRMEKTNQS